MVKYEAALDSTFAALAHPVRRAMLAALARGESTVMTLARPFNCSLPAISKHLRVLERAGLIGRRRDGRVHRLNLEASPMSEAAAWIERYRVFWEKQFDSLDQYLRDTADKESSDDSDE